MKRGLSKPQEAVLIRAQMNGGTCVATAAYAALVDLGDTLKESGEGSILARVGNTLQSLVDLGLMVKSRPGEYRLTPEGFRVAQGLGARYPVV
jgi:hypothetical protein